MMQPNVTQSLTPAQQQIFDTNQQGQQGLADLGTGAIQRADSILGQDVSFAGAPNVNAVNTSTLSPRGTAFDPNSTATLDPGRLPAMGAALDPNSLSAISDSSTTRQRVLDAMMGRANEDYAKTTDQHNSDLIARGIPVGSKAYADDRQMIERSRNDARLQAEIGASTVADQMFNQDLNRRQQEIGAQGQTYAQQTGNRTLSAAEQAQQYGQTLAGQAQQFGQEGALRSQDLAEQQAAQQASTAERARVIQELMAQRTQPLNEINAFRSGSQVAPLQFQNYTGATVAPAPIFGAAQAQGTADQNAYNAQVSQQNAMMGGLFGLGAAGVKAYPW